MGQLCLEMDFDLLSCLHSALHILKYYLLTLKNKQIFHMNIPVSRFLVLRPGSETVPPALAVQSLNHWTIGKFLQVVLTHQRVS